MSEEKIESIVRDFGEAFVKRDVEKMLSFFSEDAVWVSKGDLNFCGETLSHVKQYFNSLGQGC